jgi:peptide/nickel transport system permease protein
VTAALVVGVRALLRATGITLCCFFLTFTLFDLLPGDAARALSGAQTSAADLARLRASASSTTDLHASYKYRAFRFMHREPGADTAHDTCLSVGWVHLELGRSYVYRRPVKALLGDRIGPSLALAASVALTCTLLGLLLGFLAHEHERRVPLVPALRAVAAVPAYVVGMVLHEVLARRLGWLPLETRLGTLHETAHAMVLPLATLALAMLGPYVAVAQERWHGLAGAPFVRAAEARGATARTALWKHGKRQVLGALAAMSCLDAALLVGGAVLTERLFRWPGLGSLAVEALLGRDLELLAGVVVVAAAFVALATALGEALRPLFDPRVRY